MRCSVFKTAAHSPFPFFFIDASGGNSPPPPPTHPPPPPQNPPKTPPPPPPPFLFGDSCVFFFPSAYNSQPDFSSFFSTADALPRRQKTVDGFFFYSPFRMQLAPGCPPFLFSRSERENDVAGFSFFLFLPSAVTHVSRFLSGVASSTSRVVDSIFLSFFLPSACALTQPIFFFFFFTPPPRKGCACRGGCVTEFFSFLVLFSPPEVM